MRVSSFGVHWAPGGIPFLVQSEGSQNLISRDLVSPFEVKVRPRTLQCPHAIDLETTSEASWISDPLAQAFLPIPRARTEMVKLLHDPAGKWDNLLQQLQRLSSPTEPLMRPLWWRTPVEMMPLYGVTNISPVVFFGAESSRFGDITKHVELARAFQRRVIISVQSRLPVFGAEWIETQLTDVASEPLEAIGAGVLRKYMQHAQPE